MPAYVFRYSNREGPLLVDFDDGPGWKMIERWVAEAHCETLRNAHVCVGEHSCDFSVAELDDGAFAIVCESHPLLSATSTPPVFSTSRATKAETARHGGPHI